MLYEGKFNHKSTIYMFLVKISYHLFCSPYDNTNSLWISLYTLQGNTHTAKHQHLFQVPTLEFIFQLFTKNFHNVFATLGLFDNDTFVHIFLRYLSHCTKWLRSFTIGTAYTTMFLHKAKKNSCDSWNIPQKVGR
jgi:hypothetical protein